MYTCIHYHSSDLVIMSIVGQTRPALMLYWNRTVSGPVPAHCGMLIGMGFHHNFFWIYPYFN